MDWGYPKQVRSPVCPSGPDYQTQLKRSFDGFRQRGRRFCSRASLGTAVRCKLCERLCALGPSELGDCKARVNMDGKLYTLVYGNLSAFESRPIEIKPFFHYWPGSTALTFATWSCNLDCDWCQNYSLSKTPPGTNNSKYYSPESIVDTALGRGDEGLCASFQEPTLLADWVARTFSIAHRKGLYCCFVSNGYMTIDALRFLAGHGLDAIKIDVKGSSETYRRHCGGVRGNDVVWRNAGEAKKLGLHVEIVNLVVTDVNDDEATLRELVQRHVREVGDRDASPLHTLLSRVQVQEATDGSRKARTRLQHCQVGGHFIPIRREREQTFLREHLLPPMPEAADNS